MLNLDPRTAHDILVHDFARYLSSKKTTDERFVVAGEVTWRKNRFDLVAVDLRMPTDRRIYAFEAKVSVVGVREEIRSGKWRAMFDAGAAPYFLLPYGVASKISLNELPHEVGLVERHRNGSWGVFGRRLRPRTDRPDVSELLMSTLGAFTYLPQFCSPKIDIYECSDEPAESVA